jgi:hypothetical protein
MRPNLQIKKKVLLKLHIYRQREFRTYKAIPAILSRSLQLLLEKCVSSEWNNIIKAKGQHIEVVESKITATS